MRFGEWIADALIVREPAIVAARLRRRVPKRRAGRCAQIRIMRLKIIVQQ